LLQDSLLPGFDFQNLIEVRGGFGRHSAGALLGGSGIGIPSTGNPIRLTVPGNLQ
jgi:hypothetical protein